MRDHRLPAGTLKHVAKDEIEHLHEVRSRLDAGAGLAAQALLGEFESTVAIEGLLGLIEHCRLHLKAIDL